MKIRILYILILFIFIKTDLHASESGTLQRYIDTVQKSGVEPASYVIEKLNKHDLIIFDDGLHTAVRPFEFYRELLRNPDFLDKVRYIFLEAVPVNQQPALNSFLSAEKEQFELLYPAFQNDLSGKGWPYKTYFDLMRAVREANSGLTEEKRLRVIAVNAPSYWKEIDSPEDVDLFRLSLTGNDYTMYRIITSYLDDFSSGEKGIFLTNTRHAYKGIKNSRGDYYLNCGTFFNLRNPGKTFSIRIHNINLYIEKKKETDSETARTTEGLEQLVVEWVRMEDGLWDSAFDETGNRPIAFDLEDTPFGRAVYIGNHMLDVAPGQTIHDAYDGLIFLVPLEKTRRTAMVEFIYTDNFKRELKRRLKLLYTEAQMKRLLKEHGCKSIDEYIDLRFVYRPEAAQPMLDSIGPADLWKE